MALIRISLLCALASALVPRRGVVRQRHAIRMAAESCEFTLKGDTVAITDLCDLTDPDQMKPAKGAIKTAIEFKEQRGIEVLLATQAVQKALNAYEANPKPAEPAPTPTPKSLPLPHLKKKEPNH